jgi:uncharacterized repeat protein (TIGR03847 family)
MERPEIDWDDTDAFTVGTVGAAGRRVFFIQARRAGQVVSLKLEKQQVAGLAEFLDGIMGDLPPVDGPATDLATETGFTDPV